MRWRCSRRRSRWPARAQPAPAGCARSSVACLIGGVEDAYVAEQRARRTVTDGRDLARLGLAAVERPAEDPGLGSADGLHGLPEVGGRGLVGDVAELPV